MRRARRSGGRDGLSPTLRIAYFGGAAFAVAPLLRLANTPEFELAWCASPPPRPRGRGLANPPGPVATAAEQAGLTHQHLLADADIERELQAAEVDFAIVCAYGVKISAAALALPRRGCVNIHASLLPRWRGAAPVERAIAAGDEATGITTMLMAAKIDAGHILRQASIPIGPDATGGTLTAELSELGAELIVATLKEFDAIEPQPQNPDLVCYARKLRKNEAQLDWSERDAEELERLVRAFQPRPGAWAMVDGQRLKILRAQAAAQAGTPGTICALDKDELAIACRSGSLRLLEVQPSGGKPMPIGAWLRGHRGALATGKPA